MHEAIQQEYKRYLVAKDTLKLLVDHLRVDSSGFLTVVTDNKPEPNVINLLGFSSGDVIIDNAIIANDVFRQQVIPALKVIADTEPAYAPILQEATVSTDRRARWRIIQRLKRVMQTEK